MTQPKKGMNYIYIYDDSTLIDVNDDEDAQFFFSIFYFIIFIHSELPRFVLYFIIISGWTTVMVRKWVDTTGRSEWVIQCSPVSMILVIAVTFLALTASRKCCIIFAESLPTANDQENTV